MALLTALCHNWAHRVTKLEHELDLDEDQLVIISKLFTRPTTTSREEEEPLDPTELVNASASASEDTTLLEVCKLLSLML